MIVKMRVQPDFKKDPAAVALLYDESRDWKSVIPVTPRVIELLNGRLQAYFDINSDRHGGITFNGEVSWQGW